MSRMKEDEFKIDIPEDRGARYRYYSILYRTMLKMLVPTQLTVHIPACMYCMYRRTCANARVVSYVSRTCTAIYIFTGNRIPVRDWSPRMNILSLRYMASQVSSIHLPYHNINKFVLIVSNFA